MKLHLFPILLAALFISCGNHDTPTPTPEDTVTYQKADTMVVYECNERLFARSKAFEAIRAYLPTLQSLQVNVLWLMPVHPRGTVKSVGSPYCVKNYLTVDPAFGTLEDFRVLVNDAHSRGMLVILDFVANHTAWDHPWYQTHPEWYTTPTGDEKNWNDVAPLDYEQQVVCDTMRNTMRYWVEQYDVDGFRCDYAQGVPTKFWQATIDTLRTIKPNLIMLAETSRTEYYKAGFDWLYSWDYLGAIQSLFKGDKNLSNLYRVHRNEINSTPEGKERLRYITTHDAASENAPSTFYKTVDAELAASCLTFFLAGVPMIYSSQEIGYLQKINFFDYKILDFKETEITAKWQRLMQAYKATAVERFGTFKDYSTEKVAMFTRTQKNRSMLVIVNCTNAAEQVEIPALFASKTVHSLLDGWSGIQEPTVDLPAYGYTILTLKE